MASKPLDLHSMRCCSERLFKKLSKTEEARLLKL